MSEELPKKEFLHKIRIIRPNSGVGCWYNTRVGEIFECTIFHGTLRGDDGNFEAWCPVEVDGVENNGRCILLGDAEEITESAASKMAELDRAIAVWHRKAEPLTKREYFAAMAMQGLLSNEEQIGAISETTPAGTHGNEVARKAVQTADALIAELKRNP